MRGENRALGLSHRNGSPQEWGCPKASIVNAQTDVICRFAASGPTRVSVSGASTSPVVTAAAAVFMIEPFASGRLGQSTSSGRSKWCLGFLRPCPRPRDVSLLCITAFSNCRPQIARWACGVRAKDHDAGRIARQPVPPAAPLGKTACHPA